MIIDYIFLGILQGIFEWLPISSEGVLAIFSSLFLKNINPIEVSLFLHLGTLFAVLIYFRKEWREVLILKNKQLFKFLLISTPMSLIVGFILYGTLKTLTLGALLLIITGGGLLITSILSKSKSKIRLNSKNLPILAGFLQGLAVIPGLSRSGSTIFGLSLSNLKPEKILKISYMMSAPVIIASSLYLIISNPLILSTWPALISSFLIGIFTLHFLMRISKRINFFYFTFTFAILCFLGAIISFLV